MARADLLLGIVKAGRGGDQASLERTVEALIAEERGMQHHILAERLEGALRQNGASTFEVEPASGLRVLTPRRRFDDLVLPRRVRDACEELVEEQRHAELLRSYALEPRHRVLLLGAPGNGKTSLAEAIAEALVVPLLQVRYEAVVGSYLGETASQLARLFEFARSRRCVLFFDEFDAIAKERGDIHETGEIKRVVSSLLMQVDSLPSHTVIVAASNHPELLDRAVGRRFQLHLTLPQPELRQREEWFGAFLREAFDGRPAGLSAKVLAEKTEGASFSQLEDLTLDVRRQLVLQRPTSPRALLSDRLRRWTEDLGPRGG